MNFLYNIDDKYKYDIEILSVTFNDNKDNDFLLHHPQLILLCKSAKFGEPTANDPTGFVGYYYFKLIFTNPSTYNIYLTTNRSIYNNISNSCIVKTTLQMNYAPLLPFTADMRETQIAPNHYKWEIFFRPETTEKGYIIIYANKLEIQHLDKRPNLNTDEITNQSMHINNIDDKYKYDVEIVSITFNYWKDEDFDDANNDEVDPQQLILLCRNTNFDETKKTIIYNYFKLIFIEPSSYNIHVKPKPYASNNIADADIDLTTNSNINYIYTLPLTCQMKETQTATNHSKWEISLKHNTKEEAYIRIYADKLQIIDQEHCPDLN